MLLTTVNGANILRQIFVDGQNKGSSLLLFVNVIQPGGWSEILTLFV